MLVNHFNDYASAYTCGKCHTEISPEGSGLCDPSGDITRLGWLRQTLEEALVTSCTLTGVHVCGDCGIQGQSLTNGFCDRCRPLHKWEEHQHGRVEPPYPDGP